MSNDEVTTDVTMMDGVELVPHGPLRREVPVQIAEGDGRTLVSRLVPYNETATVNDGAGPYQERFLPGAFNAQMRAANRIKAFLNFRHGQSMQDVIGHAAEIRDQQDGLHGDLRVLETQDGDKALELYRAGVLDMLSIEFAPIRHRVVDGVIERVSARLLGIALVPEGAYSTAQVLAVRSTDVTGTELEPPKPFDPELAELFTRMGVEVPEMLQGLSRAFTEQAWDGSPSRFSDTAAYCRSCVIDDNPSGKPKVQMLCHLPVREPNGDVNVNAVRNALARVDQVSTSSAKKSSARRTLERMLAQFNNQTDSANA